MRFPCVVRRNPQPLHADVVNQNALYSYRSFVAHVCPVAAFGVGNTNCDTCWHPVVCAGILRYVLVSCMPVVALGVVVLQQHTRAVYFCEW